MNIKTICAVSISIFSFITNTAFADRSDSLSSTVSVKIPVICKAEIISIFPSATETRVNIKELCNVGGQHDVVLIHSSLDKTANALYENESATIETEGRTIIASRNGAYHGKNQLIIPHSNNEPIRILDVFIKR